MSGSERNIKRESEESKFEAHIAHLLSTEAGQALFTYLFNRCGYSQKSLVADSRSGALLEDSTMYNEARRGVYVELRRYAPLEALMKVEFKAEELNRAPVGAANKKERK